MTDKLGRANAITPYFESGNIWLPCEEIDPTIEEMIDEMMKFPNSEHDDEVDAMTQYLNVWQYKSTGRLCTEQGYNDIANAWRGLKV
jgi:predicted phage terminase large subunit-like protein